MGKIETVKGSKRHDPLGKQIQESDNQHKQQRHRTGKGAIKKKLGEIREDEYVDEEEKVISKQLSKKILSQIRQQAIEVEEEDRRDRLSTAVSRGDDQQGMVEGRDGEEDIDDQDRILLENVKNQKPLLSFDDLEDEDGDLEEDLYDQGDSKSVGGFGDDSDTESRYGEYMRTEEEEALDEEDERILQMFMGQGQGEGGVGHKAGVRFTLGQLIEAKLKEQEEKESMVKEPRQKMNPKVLEVYKKVGQMLAHYRSGKVPRAFCILPNFTNWEDLIYLTRPDLWTPHAVREATKIFVMSSNARQTQRFLSLVLLPRVRDNIAEFRKLNFHLYMALKKSLYRPQAFYKAIFLPLAEEGDATLLEAKIIASVVKKVSVPVIHSSVALLKLAQIPKYNGATSLFIMTLCDKKYSLPLRVVDSLYQHFISFVDERRDLPVLWHQSLLMFVQRYKNDIKPQHKENLKILLRNQFHHQITNEIRRELFNNQSSQQSENKMSMD
ncbi:bystin [Cavenderia fasciculata]|uniref:Bystin n=1 Tax=Cavenderia fasciculata TaxID=261658 RepID=F4QBI9_CACFS|nr:bystin [Cavenderia fasciculata]EGG14961.1 bystin [Cavenderia fasciculata]|eukprot:XP_004351477.1 bystin [Cavenderia fasciculata]